MQPFDPARVRHLHLVGERVYVRPVVPDDATPAYASWLNDLDTTRYLESGMVRETVESIAAYIEKYRNRTDALFLAIILKQGDVHVGNIKLEPISWRHRGAILGILIGDPRARGIGIGQEALVLVLRYCFDVLKLNRVALGVTADNLPAVRCYRAIGFADEGRLRQAVLREHGFVDSFWMAILADEFCRRYGAQAT